MALQLDFNLDLIRFQLFQVDFASISSDFKWILIRFLLIADWIGVSFQLISGGF